MTGDGQPRALARVNGPVHARLPFAWLVEVRFRDLATVQGRFCLGAETQETADGRRWELATVAPDLRTTERIELRIAPLAGA